MNLRVADTRDRFLLNEQPFFYLADTVWNIFTNATMEEWEEYLRFRAAQGFNALQISILPIEHDMSSSEERIYPFALNADGSWNFHEPSPIYFAKAGEMTAMARKYGFIPVLVVLWASYVKDTWASSYRPELVMPEDALAGYVDIIVETFGAHEPIYLISGDTDLPTEATSRTYQTALDRLKLLQPEALASYHPKPGLELSEQIVHDPSLDFYMYQQGHSPDARAARGAAYHYELPVKRPIINGEPYYEGIGYFKKYGRFTAFDIRRAFWQSMLAGAKAGFTYGAHGVWSWHSAGQPFTSEDLWGMPSEWRTAMRMQGAQDVSFSKWLFETYDLFDLEPASGRLLQYEEDIAMAISPDGSTAAIYMPYNMGVKVNVDFTGYFVEMIEFSGRNIIRPAREIHNGVTTFGVHSYQSDALIIARRTVKQGAHAE